VELVLSVNSGRHAECCGISFDSDEESRPDMALATPTKNAQVADISRIAAEGQGFLDWTGTIARIL
jgi:hypothetical protein